MEPSREGLSDGSCRSDGVSGALVRSRPQPFRSYCEGSGHVTQGLVYRLGVRAACWRSWFCAPDHGEGGGMGWKGGGEG